VTDRLHSSAGKRAETWLWTGPVGHLLGGALDFAGALAGYLRASRARALRPHTRAKASRARGRSVR
jgi:hypothetical protein